MAVIDMRTAVLSTQAAADAKALEEDADYASNLEEAQSSSRKTSHCRKITKELETLSQEQIAQMQKDIQDKGKDLEFLAGKIHKQGRNCPKSFFREWCSDAKNYW